MLHTAVTVLSIIGIVILCMIGFVLLLVLMLLFIATRYKISAYYHNNIYKVNITITWLFSLLAYRVNIQKEEKVEQSFSIFGKRLEKKPKKNKNKKKKNVKKQDIPGKHNETPVYQAESEDTFKKSDNNIEEDDFTKSQNSQEEKEIKEEQGKKKEEQEKKKNFFLRIIDKIKDILMKIKEVNAFLKKEENKEVFTLIKKNLLILLNHIKPKKIRGQITLGFDDPEKTGWALGALGMVFGFIGTGVMVVPDFEKSIIDGEIFIKGRIRIFNLLVIFLRCYRNRLKIKSAYDELMSLKS